MGAPSWLVAVLRQVGGALLVRAEVWDATNGRSPSEVRKIADREVKAISDSIRGSIDYQASEAEILDARLSRRFDPGTALNEAAERAIAAKKAAKAEHTILELTPTQKKALEFQKQYLQRIVDRA